MFKKYVIGVCAMLFLFGCKKNNIIEGYDRDEDGYYYKLLGIGDGTKSPEKSAILVCDAVMKTASDSVFWDTKHDAIKGLFISLAQTQNQSSGYLRFFKMVEGDSASFLVKPSAFFKEYFNTPVPFFCKNDSLVKLDIKLRKILSNREFQSWQQSQVEDKELQELKEIDTYLKANYSDVKPDNYGIYTLEKKETDLEPVGAGKRITIQFKGSYLDGRSVDATTQEMELVYGTPDQLISGLNIVIGQLKKEETTKIILPSRLAFGELGNSSGAIAPYTPIVYDIKIIDIK
jgi:FKBP-type peptidyl-prolyl cis-trans isomerase